MDAKELAAKIADLINENVDGTEAYASSANQAQKSSIEVAIDEEEKLFNITITEQIQ